MTSMYRVTCCTHDCLFLNKQLKQKVIKICIFTVFIMFFNYGEACWSSYSPPPDDETPAPSQERFKEYMETLPWKSGPEGEESWPGPLCKKGAGRRQSPIDINAQNAVRDADREFIKFGPLKFRNYRGPVKATAFNNGHTLQMIPLVKNGSEPMVTGGPLNQLYRLEQVHYHWPSEHAINGLKFPMEVHFVHVRVDLDVDDALNIYNGVAILAVFWDILLDQQLENLPPGSAPFFFRLIIPGTKIYNFDFYIWEQLNVNRKSYFTYAGSLSSPECNEAVIWIIFEEPLMVHENVYRAFGGLGVQRNNYRSLQPVVDHKVYRTTTRSFMTPLITDTLDNFKKAVQKTTRDITTKILGWFGDITKAGKQALEGQSRRKS